MEEKVNVICLYWEGDFRGRDFTEKDVWRLYASVIKHYPGEFNFYVLTNNMTADLPEFKIQLEHDWPGWWAKMELHRPDLPPGRMLYLDLDSHVIRSLQPILDYEGDLVMFNSRASKRKLNRRPEKGVVLRYQAATMLFDSGTDCMTSLYRKFCKRPNKMMKWFRSDQDVMGHYLANQPTFPDEWMVKLKQCLYTTDPPEEAIIVTGQPSNGSFRRLDEFVPWLEEMART